MLLICTQIKAVLHPLPMTTFLDGFNNSLEKDDLYY